MRKLAWTGLAIGWVMIGLAALFLRSELALPVGEGEARKTPSGRTPTGPLMAGGLPIAGLYGFEQERLWSVYDDWEPALAVDPVSADVYQVATRYDGPKPCSACKLPALVWRRSSDGGVTWGPDHFLVQTRRTQNDPQIAVATDGALYVAWLNDYRPGVQFMKSTDRGATWSAPVSLAPARQQPRWSDRPVLAISLDGQHVYVAFNAAHSYVVASHDFGATFSAPVRTDNDQRYWFHSAGAVAPDGAVYFAAVDYSQDYSGVSHINVLRSADGGQSWVTNVVDVSAEMPDCPWSEGCYFGFLGPSAGLAVNSNGVLLLAYNAGDSPGASQAVYARFSSDGAVTWTPREWLSPGLEHNAFPAAAAGPTPDDFQVVWQGSQPGQTDAWNTWYRHTAGGAHLWQSAVRLSDRPDGAPYKHPAGYQFPYGDYLEMEVNGNGAAYVIWGEGASYTGPGGLWYTREP